MPANSLISVKLTGWRELRAALKTVDQQSVVAIKAALLPVAGRIAGIASAVMPRKTGAAAASIQPRASARGASVVFGGQAAPYAPWLDFGGTVGRGHRQGVGGSGAIKRPFIKSGRYVYPTIVAEREVTAQAVLDAISSVAQAENFEVRDSG